MADNDEKKDDGEKKGGSKKLLIIGLFLGLLLGGGGGFGAFMMLSNSDKHEEAPQEEKPVVEEEPTDNLAFAKFERVTLPIIYKKRVLGNVMIDFSLEVEGDDNKRIIIHNLPEIRDALLRHYSDAPIGKDGIPRSIDYPRLKDTLKKISNKVVHGPLVKRVMVVQARQF